jgi:hypothetical protein
VEAVAVEAAVEVVVTVEIAVAAEVAALAAISIAIVTAVTAEVAAVAILVAVIAGGDRRWETELKLEAVVHRVVCGIACTEFKDRVVGSTAAPLNVECCNEAAIFCKTACGAVISVPGVTLRATLVSTLRCGL